MNAEVWHRHARANRLQSALLLGAMGALMALIGWLLWGSAGLVVLLLAVPVLALVNPAVAPGWVMRMNGAVRRPPRWHVTGLWH
jgi:heat shock protein HtpX